MKAIYEDNIITRIGLLIEEDRLTKKIKAIEITNEEVVELTECYVAPQDDNSLGKLRMASELPKIIRAGGLKIKGVPITVETSK